MEVSSLLQIHPIYFCIHNDGKPPVAFTQRIFNHHDPHTHRSIKTSFTVVKPEGLFLLTLFHKSVTPPSRGWDFCCTFSTPLIFYKSPPITPPNHSTIASLCFNQSTTSPPPPNQCWRASLAFPFKPHGKTVRLYFFLLLLLVLSAEPPGTDAGPTGEGSPDVVAAHESQRRRRGGRQAAGW